MRFLAASIYKYNCCFESYAKESKEGYSAVHDPFEWFVFNLFCLQISQLASTKILCRCQPYSFCRRFLQKDLTLKTSLPYQRLKNGWTGFGTIAGAQNCSGFVNYPGREIRGWDLPSPTGETLYYDKTIYSGQARYYNTQNSAECCSLCSRTTGCNSWTTVSAARSGSGYYSSGCWLKQAYAAQLNATLGNCAGCYSG